MPIFFKQTDEMLISVDWDDVAQTVIRYELVGRWDWASFDQAVDSAFTAMRQQNGNVDNIVDARQSSGVLSTRSIHHLRRAIKLTPPNSDLLILIPPATKYYTAEVICRTFAHEVAHFISARSLETARQTILQKHLKNQVCTA